MFIIQIRLSLSLFSSTLLLILLARLHQTGLVGFCCCCCFSFTSSTFIWTWSDGPTFWLAVSMKTPHTHNETNEIWSFFFGFYLIIFVSLSICFSFLINWRRPVTLLTGRLRVTGGNVNNHLPWVEPYDLFFSRSRSCWMGPSIWDASFDQAGQVQFRRLRLANCRQRFQRVGCHFK